MLMPQRESPGHNVMIFSMISNSHSAFSSSPTPRSIIQRSNVPTSKDPTYQGFADAVSLTTSSPGPTSSKSFPVPNPYLPGLADGLQSATSGSVIRETPLFHLYNSAAPAVQTSHETPTTERGQRRFGDAVPGDNFHSSTDGQAGRGGSLLLTGITVLM